MKLAAIIVGSVLFAAVAGYGIYLYLNSVCLEWEGVATGTKCVEWSTRVTVCTRTDSEGHLTTKPCTETYCARSVPCKRCIHRVQKEDAPAERSGNLPPDRCPGSD